MKACKFCGTQVRNEAASCPSCGSNVFLHICENCGNKFDSGFCPNCGVKAGAIKKICPDCGSSYFTTACPNCGYIPNRKPLKVEQTVIHKHVYEEKPAPARAPAQSYTPTEARQVEKKGKGCGCVVWIIAFFVLVGLFRSITDNPKKTTPTTTIRRTTATATVRVTGPTATPMPTATPDPEIVAVQEAVKAYYLANPTPTPELLGLARVNAIPGRETTYNAPAVRFSSYKNGRGQVDTVGSEPDYIGVIGYAVVNDSQRLEKGKRFPETPWQVPIYQKDKQFWEKSGEIEHKTKVVVLEQALEKPSYSNKYSVWKGYLHILRLDNNEDCWLDVTNYVTDPYWEKTLHDAIGDGYLIAEFKQVSDYYPVDRDGDKVVLEDGMKVLIPWKTIYSTSPDKENNSIPAYVFKEWKYGFGGVTVFFNDADLTLVY